MYFIERSSERHRLEAKSAKAGKKLRAVSVVPWRGSMEPSKLPTCADYIWCPEGMGR